jgi:hypothetical protein
LVSDDTIDELDSSSTVVVTICIVGGMMSLVRSTFEGEMPYLKLMGLVKAKYSPRDGGGASNRLVSMARACKTRKRTLRVTEVRRRSLKFIFSME